MQDLLDKAAPAIPEFCGLLKAYPKSPTTQLYILIYVRYTTNDFIAKQLVGMVKYLDLSDEVRRHDLTHALCIILYFYLL